MSSLIHITQAIYPASPWPMVSFTCQDTGSYVISFMESSEVLLQNNFGQIPVLLNVELVKRKRGKKYQEFNHEIKF
jgi:hypothetical protein